MNTMNRFFAALLAATLVSTPVPSYALRATESAETGLEEQLRQALNSPDDLVAAAGRLASTVLGLTPAVVRPEPSRRAGLEEFPQEASAEILEALQSTGPVTSFAQLFPRLIETAREHNVSEVVPQALLAAFRSLPTDPEKRHLTGSLGQAMMMGLHEFSEDFEPDPYPTVLPGRSTIWTVTTSPTIDIDAKKKLENWSDRKGVLVDPGGGGINIAVALARRGVRARPVFFYVGETGRLLLRLIENRGVLVREGDAIEIKEDDQTRVTIITSLDKAESLVPKGTPVDEEARRRMVARLLDPKEGVQSGDIVAISGSLAPGLPESYYADLGRELIGRGAIVITDTKGAPAREILFSPSAAATIYSQNNLEFGELVGVNPKDRNALIAKAREIINSQPPNQSIREIVITEGAGGAFSVTREKVLEIPAPKVEAVSEVGAGDTSLAERVFRAWQGKGHDAGFVYGVAAGTASVLHPGTGGGLQAEVDHFAEELGLTEETKIQPPQSLTAAGLEEVGNLRSPDRRNFLHSLLLSVNAITDPQFVPGHLDDAVVVAALIARKAASNNQRSYGQFQKDTLQGAKSAETKGLFYREEPHPDVGLGALSNASWANAILEIVLYDENKKWRPIADRDPILEYVQERLSRQGITAKKVGSYLSEFSQLLGAVFQRLTDVSAEMDSLSLSVEALPDEQFAALLLFSDNHGFLYRVKVGDDVANITWIENGTLTKTVVKFDLRSPQFAMSKMVEWTGTAQLADLNWKAIPADFATQGEALRSIKEQLSGTSFLGGLEETYLAVDDTAEDLERLVVALQRARPGATILSFQDVDLALQTLRERSAEISGVISDYNLKPGLSGVGLLREARKAGYRGPFSIQSDATRDEDVLETLDWLRARLSLTAYADKPKWDDDFFTAVTTLLGAMDTARAAAVGTN